MSKYEPFWQQRELERLLSQMRPTFDVLSQIPPSYFDNLRAFEDLSRKYSFPTEYLSLSEEILKGINTSDLVSSLSMFDRIDKAYVSAFESLHKDMASTFAAVASATSAIDIVSALISESLANAEALAKSYSLAESGIAALLRYHDPFEKFATDKLFAASAASLAFQENTASAIAEAARLLPDLSYVSELSAIMAPELLESVLHLPRINVFEELGEELVLVDLEDSQADVVAAVEGSSANRVVEVGGRLVRRVFELNTEAERRGKKPVFTPTTRTMMAFHQVPSTVASDEGGFLEVVDALFFLLYEGSGAAARLTERFEVDRLQALWLLKHLRLGARHDLDHGKPKEATRKMRSVGEAYEELVGVPVPKSKAEWQQAQQALYERLAEMLDDLWLNSD